MNISIGGQGFITVLHERDTFSSLQCCQEVYSIPNQISTLPHVPSQLPHSARNENQFVPDQLYLRIFGMHRA